MRIYDEDGNLICPDPEDELLGSLLPIILPILIPIVFLVIVVSVASEAVKVYGAIGVVSTITYIISTSVLVCYSQWEFIVFYSDTADKARTVVIRATLTVLFMLASIISFLYLPTEHAQKLFSAITFALLVAVLAFVLVASAIVLPLALYDEIRNKHTTKTLWRVSVLIADIAFLLTACTLAALANPKGTVAMLLKTVLDLIF